MKIKHIVESMLRFGDVWYNHDRFKVGSKEFNIIHFRLDGGNTVVQISEYSGQVPVTSLEIIEPTFTYETKKELKQIINACFEYVQAHTPLIQSMNGGDQAEFYFFLNSPDLDNLENDLKAFSSGDGDMEFVGRTVYGGRTFSKFKATIKLKKGA